jgi:hypothetical protein
MQFSLLRWIIVLRDVPALGIQLPRKTCRSAPTGHSQKRNHYSLSRLRQRCRNCKTFSGKI